MGLGATIITFLPGNTILHADVNSNFTNLNNATTLTGTAEFATKAVNMRLNGGTLGASAASTSTLTVAQGADDANGNPLRTYSLFSGSGTVTASHGYATQTPTMIMLMTNSANNAMNMGCDSIGSTTVHINTANVFSWFAAASFMG